MPWSAPNIFCKMSSLLFSVLIVSTVVSGLWRTVSGMLRMLGYDRNEIGRMSINMILYTGEMLANTILDIETNNIDTELEQFRAFSDSGNWFTYAKVINVIFINLYQYQSIFYIRVLWRGLIPEEIK